MSMLPNPGLLQYLIRNYYQNDAGTEANELVSSHWRHHSEQFDVAFDADGNLLSLAGSEFGVCRWKGIGHQILDRLCVLSHLVHLEHRRSLLRALSVASQVCSDMGLHPTLDVFRQACSLALLQRQLSAEPHDSPLAFLMIGDGYGVLAAMVKWVFPGATLVMVDIGKTLLFQGYYCQLAHPHNRHLLFDQVRDLGDADFVYCPADDLEYLEDFKFDVAVNIASMQEMNTASVSRYFAFLRKCLLPDNLFYCCNRESKTLMGGETSEFEKYPWLPEDHTLVDGQCPWHSYSFGRSNAPRGPKLLGLRVPIVNFYDGTIRHRLAKLVTA